MRVETRDGLVYEFDYATYDPDSLTGYRLRTELEGPVDQSWRSCGSRSTT